MVTQVNKVLQVLQVIQVKMENKVIPVYKVIQDPRVSKARWVFRAKLALLDKLEKEA